MIEQALLWFFITLLCIIVQGIYSMIEMAAVSFNRVRLEYYVSKKIKRAIWLKYLMEKPSRLFGTVMLAVNIGLQVGSQSSREFYRALHLNPDIAAVTQIFLVVIVAELAPIFAAHRYAEHVIMLGVPIVYFTYWLLAPLIWAISLFSNCLTFFFTGKKKGKDVLLTREELQKILESHAEELLEGDEFNYVVSTIFSLKNKTASEEMTPLNEHELISAQTTIEELRQKLQKKRVAFVPIFHKTPANIVAIALPKDLVRSNPKKPVREYARPPWFITQDLSLLHILKQFRRNNQNVAIVLDHQGAAIGILTLTDIFEVIFGENPSQKGLGQSPSSIIDRTFPGDKKIAEFNQEYQANLDAQGSETLAQLMLAKLERMPEEGESVTIGAFELTAEETSLLGIKSVSVKSIDQISN